MYIMMELSLRMQGCSLNLVGMWMLEVVIPAYAGLFLTATLPFAGPVSYPCVCRVVPMLKV